MIQEFDVGEHMLKDKCPICKKKFKLKEKIVLAREARWAIQQPAGDYWINAISLPIHTKCFYVEK